MLFRFSLTNHEWWGTLFHMPYCLSLVFYREVSVHLPDPFLNEVVWCYWNLRMLYRLWTSAFILSDVLYAHNFFHSVGWLFTVALISFVMQTIFYNSSTWSSSFCLLLGLLSVPLWPLGRRNLKQYFKEAKNSSWVSIAIGAHNKFGELTWIKCVWAGPSLRRYLKIWEFGNMKADKEI